ncbi:hypothetical protein D3C71_1840230 [compost metagenome]
MDNNQSGLIHHHIQPLGILLMMNKRKQHFLLQIEGNGTLSGAGRMNQRIGSNECNHIAVDGKAGIAEKQLAAGQPVGVACKLLEAADPRIILQPHVLGQNVS